MNLYKHSDYSNANKMFILFGRVRSYSDAQLERGNLI